jgi:pimeloyl-ACP methyl ester carboxylesterase
LTTNLFLVEDLEDADAWDGQVLFLVQKGYRCVALDRRGHGRSSQASANNDMNGYADDLAAVIEALGRSTWSWCAAAAGPYSSTLG